MGTNPIEFSYQTLDGLIEACIKHYRDFLEKGDEPEVCRRRSQLSEWIEKFHEECGTLNSHVQGSLENLRSGHCLFIMTAHQPNFFAYGGVLRKATLNSVLAEKLSERLNLPVVSFFGLADQDFTDDRWVKSALLPDVERRDGVFEIRCDLPEKLMLSSVAKPSRKVLDSWKNGIKDWFERNSNLVSRLFTSLDLGLDHRKNVLARNFQKLWSIVEESYSRAEVCADFNAYIMSRIINDTWGYNTLFSRFSECQRIFEREMCIVLSRFKEYSQYLKEATMSVESVQKGVFEQEYNTLPFWHNCDCGSKARLTADQQGECLRGQGQCLRCGREYRIDIMSNGKPDISRIMSRISARSLAMPLVFFEGFQVSCYVGGVGGTEYLRQARYVSEHMKMNFPPVVVWRPRDIYYGIGQLAALFTFKNLSGTLDFSDYDIVKAGLEEKLANVKKEIEALESKKKELAEDLTKRKEEVICNMRTLSAQQNQTRRDSNFSLLARDLKLFENIEKVMSLYPCIVDYAVNIGLEKTSEQWIAYLKKNGNLLSDVCLKTNFEVPTMTSWARLGIR